MAGADFPFCSTFYDKGDKYFYSFCDSRIFLSHAFSLFFLRLEKCACCFSSLSQFPSSSLESWLRDDESAA